MRNDTFIKGLDITKSYNISLYHENCTEYETSDIIINKRAKNKSERIERNLRKVFNLILLEAKDANPILSLFFSSAFHRLSNHNWAGGAW